MVPAEELEDYPRSRWRGPLGIAVALIVLGVVAYGVLTPSTVELSPGEPAPEFELALMNDEGALSSEELRGKAVVLNFWRSNCPPCFEETPRLQRAWERYRDEGLVVVGVDLHEDSDAAAGRFLDAVDATYPMVKDDGRLAKALEVEYALMPQTFFIEEDWTFESVGGEVLSDGGGVKVFGEVTPEVLDAQIEALLQD